MQARPKSYILGLCCSVLLTCLPFSIVRAAEDDFCGSWDSPLLRLESCTKLLERRPPVDAERRADALIERARAYGELGDTRAELEDYARAIQLPNAAAATAAALHDRARIYLERGDIPSALADAEELVRRNPRNFNALLLRAECHSRLGDRDKALSDYDAALRVGPLDTGALLQRAFLHFSRGEYRPALADFDAAAGQAGFGSGRIHFGRAGIYRDQGDISDAKVEQRKALLQQAQDFESEHKPGMAIAAYSALLKGDRRNIELLHKRAVLLIEIGQPIQALADLAEVIKRQPGNQAAVLERARALDAAGRKVEFLEAAQDLISKGIANDKIYIALGGIYFAKGQIKKSIEIYSNAIEIHAKARDARFLANELRRVRAGAYVEDRQFDKARRDIDAFLANDLPMMKDYSCPIAEDPNGNDQWVFRYDPQVLDYCVKGRDLRVLRGRANIGLRDWDAAVADFTEAIKAVPTAAESFVWRGKAYEGRGDRSLALADFDRALVLAAGNAEAWLGRGNIFLYRGKTAEAEAAYSSALKLNPGLIDAWYHRGVVRSGRHRWGTAIADFTQGLRRNPKRPDLLKARGEAYLQDGQYRKAIGDLSTALARGSPKKETYFNRGLAYAALGDSARSLSDFAEYSRHQALDD